MTAVPAVGDTSLIGSYLINTRLYGYVVPGSASQEFTATYEIQGDQGTLTIAVVMGGEGPAGADMFALQLVTDAIASPSDLPENLTKTVADIGKTWMFDDIDANGDVIGSSAYVWYGTSYRRMMFGQPGPPGPVPIITPEVALIPYPGNSYVVPGGTPYEPTLDFKLAVPPGPRGPAAALALCPDVDFESVAPVPGDVLGYTGRSYSTVLDVPPQLMLFTSSGGGSLAAGSYSWVITALSGAPYGAVNGETTVSNEVTATVAGTHSSALLQWLPVTGAVGYRVYRTATNGSPGTENTLVTTINSGATLAYTDTGGAGSGITPPVTNTAEMTFPLWVPVSISQLLPGPYSMPESAFTPYSGVSTQAAIGSFVIPPQPFPWTPIVWGHIGAFGLELSANPLLIGCEVLLGDARSGTLVARGFGNTLGEVNIMPHYSTPRAPGTAVSPTNARAVVPANHSNPSEGTIYVNLANDGEIGLYVYNPTDSQVFVMLMPVTE